MWDLGMWAVTIPPILFLRNDLPNKFGTRDRPRNAVYPD